MVKPEELELFEHLARNNKLRAWLTDKLAEETQVLYLALDIDQLRRTQGRAQCWQMMLTLMDKAPGALKR